MKEMKLFLMMAIMELVKKGKEIINNDKYVVYENKNGNRYIHGKDNKFNMYFRKSDGFTAKWGETFDEDPAYNPYGNEIADIEITKRCKGIRNAEGIHTPCPWCYKSNTGIGDYMNFETFKKLFDILNEAKTMTQIAFGTGASLTEDENPDYWKIFEYCKENGVTPNVTVADISEETAKKMVNTFGACAVSYYPLINKNRCYDTIEKLIRNAKEINRDMKVNIHCLLAEETINGVNSLLDDFHKDSRLNGVNAIVFLSLKQKGRGVHFNKMNFDGFKEIIERCKNEKIPYGMDSCSANKFFRVIENWENKESIIPLIEPCEATQFSSFFDCYGTYFPCSFMEKEGEWEQGVKLNDIKNINDIWYEKRVVEWRNESMKNINCLGCNKCHHFDI